MSSSSDALEPGSAVGVVSIGEMGAGIASFLVAKGFTVVTNVTGRSDDTIKRAQEAGVRLLKTDEELVRASAVILSVVPPRDAHATAQRVVDALSFSTVSSSTDVVVTSSAPPLYYVDLNAVSPSSASAIAALLARARSPVRFVDACILGGPPRPLSAPDPGTNLTSSSSTSSSASSSDWTTPGVPTSGPHVLSEAPGSITPRVATLLGTSHIGPEVGAASGLKMCFASLSKGLTALAVQSFSSAHALGVLPALRTELAARLPVHLDLAERGLRAMPPKAYRWVREMEEIADTHRDAAGFADDANVFRGAAGVFRAVAEDTVLGAEKVGKRVRGTTADDVAAAMTDGLSRKGKKTD